MMNLLNELQGAKRIGISGHVRPDGDCVGSCLAMKRYLENALEGVEAKLFLEQPPTVFSYLYGFDSIDSSFVDERGFDVYIALDAGSVDRLGDAEPIFRAAGKTICIDHHETNMGYGNVNLIRGEASSTCEMVFELLEKQYMDREVAMALYTGIVHDTGVFQYSCMGKATFGVVGELIEYGFDTQKIISETFYEKSYVQNQILGRALLESILFMDGKCIASCIGKKMMDFYGVNSKDFEGIVNQLLYTKGIEVAIFLYEIQPLEYKVSMRSKGKVNVATIAAYFGGGGHVRAGGCTMKGTYRDTLNNLSAQIEAQLQVK